MTRYWCGVVSREHIKRGEQGGFCQVCHGKRGPLERMEVGDGIVFYSPVLQFGGRDACQRFTAIGKVSGEETYRFQMAPNFIPFRRDIAYLPAREAAIRPLLHALQFVQGQPSWGYPFRFGHFELSAHDFMLIAAAMLPDSWQMEFPGKNVAPALPRQGDLFGY